MSALASVHVSGFGGGCLPHKLPVFGCTLAQDSHPLENVQSGPDMCSFRLQWLGRVCSDPSRRRQAAGHTQARISRDTRLGHASAEQWLEEEERHPRPPGMRPGPCGPASRHASGVLSAWRTKPGDEEWRHWWGTGVGR